MRAWLGTRYSRLVCRCVPGLLWRVPSAGGKRVHLSLDDGPTERGTGPLLDVLDRFGVPATFFLLGRNVEQHPRAVRAIVDAGHAVGNHTYSHVDAWKESASDVEFELEAGTRVLEEATGRPVTWLRPPFGRITKPLVRWAKENGQQIVMWDLMPPDFEPESTAAGVARVLERGVRRGSIVVLHDNAKAEGVTAAALAEAIPRMQDAGWEFVGLAEGVEVPQAVPAG